MHSFVIGEIACGTLSTRGPTLELQQQLPVAPVAEPDEAPGFIALRGLHGKRIGYVGIHLLASISLSAGSQLWTLDKRQASPGNGRSAGKRSRRATHALNTVPFTIP